MGRKKRIKMMKTSRRPLILNRLMISTYPSRCRACMTPFLRTQAKFQQIEVINMEIKWIENGI